jgi:hypothetical protein
MTQDEYVLQLEKQVDPALVEAFKDWPADTKLYMYIHNIQLAYMKDFQKSVQKLVDLLE